MIERSQAPHHFRGHAREGLAARSSAAFFTGSKLERHAYELAVDAHAGQRQESDDTPYIEHPVAVARLLQRAGFGDRVVAAALLHDTVEDSDVRIEDLERRFGRSVAKLVAAMTEPEHPRGFRDRKAAHRRQVAAAGRDASAIFAADKVANLQNLRKAVAQQGEERVRRRLSKPLEQKLDHYRKSLEMLEDLALPLSLIPSLREELEGFEAERARSVSVKPASAR